jgi:hypothetical protein
MSTIKTSWPAQNTLKQDAYANTWWTLGSFFIICESINFTGKATTSVALMGSGVPICMCHFNNTFQYAEHSQDSRTPATLDQPFSALVLIANIKFKVFTVAAGTAVAVTVTPSWADGANVSNGCAERISVQSEAVFPPEIFAQMNSPDLHGVIQNAPLPHPPHWRWLWPRGASGSRPDAELLRWQRGAPSPAVGDNSRLRLNLHLDYNDEGSRISAVWADSKAHLFVLPVNQAQNSLAFSEITRLISLLYSAFGNLDDALLPPILSRDWESWVQCYVGTDIDKTPNNTACNCVHCCFLWPEQWAIVYMTLCSRTHWIWRKSVQRGH